MDEFPGKIISAKYGHFDEGEKNIFSKNNHNKILGSILMYPG